MEKSKQCIVIDYVSGTTEVVIDFYDKETGAQINKVVLDVTEAFELSNILALAVRYVYAALAR